MHFSITIAALAAAVIAAPHAKRDLVVVVETETDIVWVTEVVTVTVGYPPGFIVPVTTTSTTPLASSSSADGGPHTYTFKDPTYFPVLSTSTDAQPVYTVLSSATSTSRAPLSLTVPFPVYTSPVASVSTVVLSSSSSSSSASTSDVVSSPILSASTSLIVGSPLMTSTSSVLAPAVTSSSASTLSVVSPATASSSASTTSAIPAAITSTFTSTSTSTSSVIAPSSTSTSTSTSSVAAPSSTSTSTSTSSIAPTSISSTSIILPPIVLSTSTPDAISPTTTSLSTISLTSTTSSTSSTTSPSTTSLVTTTSSTSTTLVVQSTSSSTTSPFTLPTTYNELVVAHHNLHRRNHSAPDLVWDTGLANAAAKIAASCTYAHDVTTDANVIGGYGQNIAAGVTADNVSAIITELFYNGEVGWYDGLYGQAQPDMTNFEHWGHFSQIVWHDTSKVGCATQQCSVLADVPSNVPPYFTVCNYQSPGNVGGEYTEVGASLGMPTAHWNYFS